MYVDMLLDLAYSISINIIFWECVVKSAIYSVLDFLETCLNRRCQ